MCVSKKLLEILCIVSLCQINYLFFMDGSHIYGTIKIGEVKERRGVKIIISRWGKSQRGAKCFSEGDLTPLDPMTLLMLKISNIKTCDKGPTYEEPFVVKCLRELINI